jgi:nucleoside-diphosphate-sugar epimerase
MQEELAPRRRRERTILVTGGTGFLGGHIVAELLARGYRVLALARPRGRLSGAQRIARLLDWFGLDAGARARLDIVEGFIDEPRFGMAQPEYSHLLRAVTEIIHCASDTSFTERKRAAVEEANIGGTGHVLELAQRGRCTFFHYLSTAYVAGRKTGPCPEELVDTDAFTNVYEETKYRAEMITAERCRQAGIGLSVYRPSIVCGHSQTGRSLSFKAVYYPVRTVLFMRNLFAADIRERGGAKAGEMGVRLAPGGSLYLPLKVEVVKNGGVNVVPVDYFVEAFTAIMEDGLDGGIFHIVNRRLTRIEDLIAYTQRLFRIDGIEPCGAEAHNGSAGNPLQILFDKYLEAYGPYMRDTRSFADEETQAIMSKRGAACPDFDFAVFSRCMQYALECGWGNRLFANGCGTLA